MCLKFVQSFRGHQSTPLDSVTRWSCSLRCPSPQLRQIYSYCCILCLNVRYIHDVFVMDDPESLLYKRTRCREFPTIRTPATTGNATSWGSTGLPYPVGRSTRLPYPVGRSTRLPYPLRRVPSCCIQLGEYRATVSSWGSTGLPSPVGGTDFYIHKC